MKAEELKFDEPSRFPSSTNDITFIVDADVPYSAFTKVIEEGRSPLLADYSLIGIYKDAALTMKKSVTIRFTFSSKERTLEAAEVQEAADALRRSMAAIGAVTLG